MHYEIVDCSTKVLGESDVAPEHSHCLSGFAPPLSTLASALSRVIASSSKSIPVACTYL